MGYIGAVANDAPLLMHLTVDFYEHIHTETPDQTGCVLYFDKIPFLFFVFF